MTLTLLALVLFTRDKSPVETSSMVMIAALTIGFELFPFQSNGLTLPAVEFFHGFGHEALVAVCALMLVGQGLVRTGALEPLGRILAMLWRARPTLAMLLTLTVAAALSAFVNNAPIAVLLPVLINAHQVLAVCGADADGLCHVDRRCHFRRRDRRHRRLICLHDRRNAGLSDVALCARRVGAKQVWR